MVVIADGDIIMLAANCACLNWSIFPVLALTKAPRAFPPLLVFAGVDSYQKNVDMLGARTLMGKALFSDAGIVLHNIEVRFVHPYIHTHS